MRETLRPEGQRPDPDGPRPRRRACPERREAPAQPAVGARAPATPAPGRRRGPTRAASRRRRSTASTREHPGRGRKRLVAEHPPGDGVDPGRPQLGAADRFGRLWIGVAESLQHEIPAPGGAGTHPDPVHLRVKAVARARRFSAAHERGSFSFDAGITGSASLWRRRPCPSTGRLRARLSGPGRSRRVERLHQRRADRRAGCGDRRSRECRGCEQGRNRGEDWAAPHGCQP